MLEKSLQYQFSCLLQLLEQLSAKQYTQSLDLLLNHSIGEHVRHTLQFQENLIKGYSNGVVCYDKRDRSCDTAFDIETAKTQCENFIVQLNDFTQDKSLTLELTVSGEKIVLPTSLFRELFYVHEHTIHHLAILRMGVEKELGIEHGIKDLGIAPSTLMYLKEQ